MVTRQGNNTATLTFDIKHITEMRLVIASQRIYKDIERIWARTLRVTRVIDVPNVCHKYWTVCHSIIIMTERTVTV